MCSNLFFTLLVLTFAVTWNAFDCVLLTVETEDIIGLFICVVPSLDKVSKLAPISQCPGVLNFTPAFPFSAVFAIPSTPVAKVFCASLISDIVSSVGLNPSASANLEACPKYSNEGFCIPKLLLVLEAIAEVTELSPPTDKAASLKG